MAKDFSKSTGAKALKAVAKKSNETANANFIIWVNDTDLIDYSENEDMGFSLATTEDLEIAIEENGFKVPLEVIPLSNGKYRIISGHRRRLAGRNKGMTSFPVIVKEDLGEVKNRRAVLEANFRREMTPMQYAKLIAAWEEQLKKEQMKGDKRKYISKVLNLSEAQISRYNSLNKMINPLQELVDNGEIGLSSVSSISKYSNEEQEEILILFKQFIDSNSDVPEDEKYDLLTRDKAKELLVAYEDGLRDYDEIQVIGQMNINDEEYVSLHPGKSSISSPEAESKSILTFEVDGESYDYLWSEIIISLISEMISYEFEFDIEDINGDCCSVSGNYYYAYNVKNDGYITIEDDKEEVLFMVSTERFKVEYEFHKAKLSALKEPEQTESQPKDKIKSDDFKIHYPLELDGNEKKSKANNISENDVPGNTDNRLEIIASDKSIPGVLSFEKIQPELPILKNNDQRKAFIDAYETWPIWIDLPQTGERYYRYALTEKVAMVVKVSLRHVYHGYIELEEVTYTSPQYYLLGIKTSYSTKVTYHEEPSRTFAECSSNVTDMVNYLKEFQKGKVTA